ncbi:type II toxin-antitoxin system RelE/ParE family toxin [Thiospirochaeta perfilievii]|uniref:type II toxin-antitoxin system RelE/ParE family toxin n=1 Tax=Thiospirochaeta perfilievii TaxID=252967 RepID=UPI0016596DBC|nr:type II toxin-antitoxin system RelE/ParE family toxin [Thiospirochaeta perfilievii]
MKCYFSNKKLEKLYTTGKSKKYKLSEEIVRDFIWLVGIIDAAKDIYDFWDQPSLNFEKLQGFKNRHSFRINRKYRLEVDIEWENDDQTIGIVGIDEVSKHYQ